VSQPLDGANASDPAPDRRPRSGIGRAARRYLPFVAIAAVVGVVVAVVGTGGDGGDEGDSDGGGGAASGELTSNEQLILSGPMTPQRAELEGVEPDFGPNCDTERGTMKLPTVLAPVCVEPFTGDNGGATATGVTEDEILIVYYQTNPDADPLGRSILTSAGTDVDPEASSQVMEEFADLYNELFETYGRRVVVESFLGTGPSDDEEAVRADAIAIAEREPFAVVGAPLQSTPVFAEELASRGVICAGFCPAAVADDIVEANQPYILPLGITPKQASLLAAEMIGKLAGPGPAELAGDPELREEERRYGLVWFDNPAGDQAESVQAMQDALAEWGVEIAPEGDVQYELDLARLQDSARTIVSRLKAAGVTTVIFRGDFVMPQALTAEATAQDYFPEWILGPSVLADTTVYARQTDGEQWKNGFGIAPTNVARTDPSASGSFLLYDWAFGGAPPTNTINVLEPQLRGMFAAIQLAGPELTPESFRDALFRIPPRGSSPTAPQVSFGDHGVWPDLDLGGIDDATIIWWGPEVEGPDESGNEGQGMYRYANGGQRYTLGEFPESLEEAGLFDEESSVTIYEQLPPDDQPPDYPRPQFERVQSAPGGGS
jgi:hypothetical protein